MGWCLPAGRSVCRFFSGRYCYMKSAFFFTFTATRLRSPSEMQGRSNRALPSFHLACHWPSHGSPCEIARPLAALVRTSATAHMVDRRACPTANHHCRATHLRDTWQLVGAACPACPLPARICTALFFSIFRTHTHPTPTPFALRPSYSLGTPAARRSPPLSARNDPTPPFPLHI